jgi:hypothetical protein
MISTSSTPIEAAYLGGLKGDDKTKFLVVPCLEDGSGGCLRIGDVLKFPGANVKENECVFVCAVLKFPYRLDWSCGSSTPPPPSMTLLCMRLCGLSKFNFEELVAGKSRAFTPQTAKQNNPAGLAFEHIPISTGKATLPQRLERCLLFYLLLDKLAVTKPFVAAGNLAMSMMIL